MSEKIVRDGDVIVRELGALRRITLNRPQSAQRPHARHGRHHDGIPARNGRDDPAVGAVLLDGAGERGLCAGGDIRALYDAAKSGDSVARALLGDRIPLECSDRALSASR